MNLLSRGSIDGLDDHGLSEGIVEGPSDGLLDGSEDGKLLGLLDTSKEGKSLKSKLGSADELVDGTKLETTLGEKLVFDGF